MDFEKEYNDKLQEALKNQNYDKISSLFFELKVLRKKFKKNKKITIF